ncbi:ATP-binding protein [Nonomuraea sp. NPDC002799]
MSRDLGGFWLPGVASSVPVARQCAKAVLAEVNCDLGDVLLVISELVTNAVNHSRSGMPGGWVRVKVEWTDAGLVGVEVLDDGSASVPFPRRPDAGRVSGRGLWLVDDLAEEWGVRRFGNERSAVWAQVSVSVAEALA